MNKFKTVKKVLYVDINHNPDNTMFEPIKCSCGSLIVRTTKYAKLERFNVKKQKFYTIKMENIGAEYMYHCNNLKCYKAHYILGCEPDFDRGLRYD